MWNSDPPLQETVEKDSLGSSFLAEEPVNERSRSVLLADEEGPPIELDKATMRRAGFSLAVARNGPEVFENIREHRPDLLFLSLNLPQMNGDECCRKIKSDPDLETIPVILLTHGRENDEMARCSDAGCDDILIRPMTRMHFFGAARKFVQAEQRVDPRVDARLLVRFGPDERILSGYSINLSTGGLFLETDKPLPIDSPLNLEFLLPGPGKKIRCRGRVAWLNSPERVPKRDLPAGIGVQFLNLTLDHMEALRAFVYSKNLTPTW